MAKTENEILELTASATDAELRAILSDSDDALLVDYALRELERRATA